MLPFNSHALAAFRGRDALGSKVSVPDENSPMVRSKYPQSAGWRTAPGACPRGGGRHRTRCRPPGHSGRRPAPPRACVSSRSSAPSRQTGDCHFAPSGSFRPALTATSSAGRTSRHHPTDPPAARGRPEAHPAAQDVVSSGSVFLNMGLNPPSSLTQRIGQSFLNVYPTIRLRPDQ